MSKPSVRYILHPGYVDSISDGQRHHIGATTLARLYGVPYLECVVVMEDDPLRLVGQAGDIHLYPSHNGRYELPDLHSQTCPCKFCGEPTRMTATKMCDFCFEVDRRLERFASTSSGLQRLQEVIVTELRKTNKLKTVGDG